ncbi:hypothetical protein QFC19_009512 [Naganishia cerealis]|uniref:Uncharacterized protein n=1 Tax=Naganishia cerealis TaxID=610337 RepID=A0ACC2UU55_9TREE|nr:hypothetical protein QFC19_009512 [Naganishia cerealis]
MALSNNNAVNAAPLIDTRKLSDENTHHPPISNRVSMSSPVHLLKGNTSVDSMTPTSIQASPMQVGFGSAPTSRGGTPQIHNLPGAHGQPFMNMGGNVAMDRNRWNNPWTGMPMSTMPQQSQQIHSEVDALSQHPQQTSQQLYSGVSSHVGTPIHQPSLNSLMPPRGRASLAIAPNTGVLDPNMFVGMNQGDNQKVENRDQQQQQQRQQPKLPSAQSQQQNSGGRINLGWAAGGSSGPSRNTIGVNVSPVVTVNPQQGGSQNGVTQTQNFSGPASGVSSQHGSPTAHIGSTNTIATWPEVQNPGAQLQQQRQSISHGGLKGMMAKHPASGHPTPISSPLAKQQVLQPSNPMMAPSHHQLNPDINMMHAMGLNMIRNGQEAEFVRRHSGAGTLDHSSGSNTPHAFAPPPGGPLANMSGQYTMSAPGMGMAPRPFNVAPQQGFDGNFQPFPYNGNQHGLASQGMTSPVNPLSLAFGQQNQQGPMDFQANMNQQGNLNTTYNQGIQQPPQGVMSSHNPGMPHIRSSLSLPSTPALTSAKSLDSGFSVGSHGSLHQHQPHIHSNLANKVEFSVPFDPPIQPKQEPVDIDMSAMGTRSAVHSRQGSPLLEHVGSNSPLGVKRSSSGTRKKEKDRPEPIYTYSGAQPVPAGKPAADEDGKLASVDGVMDEHDLEFREAKIDHRKRKRNRTIQSCLPCHQNKRKCDRKKPCSRCKTLGLVSFLTSKMDDPDQTENDHLRSRIAELEQVVRELRQKNSNKAPSTAIYPTIETDPANKKRKVIVDRFAKFRYDEVMRSVNAPSSEDQKTNTSFPIHPLKPSNSDQHDEEQQPHGETSRKTSMTDDLGPDTGRNSMADDSEMRLPNGDYTSEPYIANLKGEGDSIIGDAAGRKAYVYVNFGVVQETQLTNCARIIFLFSGVPGGRQLLKSLNKLSESKTMNLGNSEPMPGVPEDLAFTGIFSDLRKTFPFTTIWSHDNFTGEIIGLLPTESQSELLWYAFESEIACFFAAWHLPSLKADFKAFFAATHDEKTVTPLGTLSVMLMICALGVMMRASQTEIFGETAGVSSPQEAEVDLTCSRLQSELYLSGAYQALRLCSFLSTPTVSTVTSGIMIGIYLLNSERASDFWPELGSIIRQAISMGLHIDPLHIYPNMSQKDAEVRRRMWWTIAGLDALVCLSLGRPSSITYYTTKLPQDIPDDRLGDVAPEHAKQSPVSSETTTFTYHAAYFALTIPSLDILDRVFPKKRKYGRNGVLGWFAPPVEDNIDEPDSSSEQGSSTYEDALRLDDDIVSWYNLIPRKMRFDADQDLTSTLLEQRSYWQIQQTLALCVKTNMIRLILHRPYLRMDPEAYPRSSSICFDAAHAILSAFKAMVGTKCSIVWSWWTMSLRAFHSAAVCAFLAMRKPSDPMAAVCLADIDGAVTIFEGRLSTWLKAHPVQADLCHGMVSLQTLAQAAINQTQSQPESESKKPFTPSTTGLGLSKANHPGKMDFSSIQAFPSSGIFPPSAGLFPPSPDVFSQPSHGTGAATPGATAPHHNSGKQALALHLSFDSDFAFLPGQSRDGTFNLDLTGLAGGAADAMALPQFWAEVCK